MEWIVAAALALAGLVVAVGFWLGQRDPVTRHYKPGMDGFFRIDAPCYLPSTARCATTIPMAVARGNGNLERPPIQCISGTRRLGLILFRSPSLNWLLTWGLRYPALG